VPGGRRTPGRPGRAGAQVMARHRHPGPGRGAGAARPLALPQASVRARPGAAGGGGPSADRGRPHRRHHSRGGALPERVGPVILNATRGRPPPGG